jgi:hypothetical protein
MQALLTILAGLPGLLSRLLDLFAARQKAEERQAVRAEERAALDVEAEREELRQLKDMMDAQDHAHSDLPDVPAAAGRLRDGSF